MTEYEIGDGVTPCPDGQLWNNKIRECQDEEDWKQFMEDRWYSDDINEVNTSYDQNQPIGDEPQALNTELSNSEPIDAETGQDFLDIQYGGQSKKIGEFQTVWQQLGYESLNLDGTGVARATRGVNPNTTPQQLLTFVYVSKSDCPICKQYDGQTWSVDSPNRPVIPRLEKGNKSRPFTHPHCKCKWVSVFLTKDQGSIDTPQTLGSTEVNQADFDRTRKWYGAGFDDLTRIQQKMAMIDMLKQSLGMETNTIESIIAVESEPSPYGIQNMLSDIVSKSLNKGEKKEIEESNELEKDFSLNTLLDLIADKLAKKIGKKLGVESKPNEYTKDDSYRSECQICGSPLDEHPITEGNDPHEWLAEQPADWEGDMSPANEDIYDNAWDGLDDEQKRMYNTLDDVESEGGINKNEYLQIANAMGVKRGNEGIPPEWYDQYFGSKEIGDFNPKEGYQEVTYCKLCDEILDMATVEDMNKHLINRHGIEWTSATEGGKGSGRIGHQKWMLAGEVGEECPNCMMITEKENGKCVICGK